MNTPSSPRPPVNRSRRRLYESGLSATEGAFPPENQPQLSDEEPDLIDNLIAPPEATEGPVLVLPPARVLHLLRKRPVSSAVPERPTHARREQALTLIQKFRKRAIRGAMIPLPGLDLALIARLQRKMLRELADLYGMSLTEEGARSLTDYWIQGYDLFTAGGSFLGSAAKWIPLVGSVAGATSVAVSADASTRDIGLAFLNHVDRPEDEEN